MSEAASVTDLADQHFFVTELFTDNEKTAKPLSSQEIEQFARDGYLAGPRILDDQQLAAIRDELSELTNPGHPGSELWYEYHSNESADPERVLFHALGSWRLRPALHDVLWNASFTVPASQLLGGSVRFWHDQLFCKPARHGGVVAWHQDYSYWTRTTPMAHLTCWIALDDASAENGCVNYVAGSHKWDLLPITGLAGDMDRIREVLTEEQWEMLSKPTAVELKAGHCVFHHPLTVHGSFENNTATQRRALVLNVVKDGVCSAADEPLLVGCDLIRQGQPLGGKFFPLLRAVS